ncbi:MAG TPA: hypothetical protein VEA69_10445 [Tepidisphaeraceae bacterium]|nr:hypothetical protein [Tepidisphaeraceae bacterium]
MPRASDHLRDACDQLNGAFAELESLIRSRGADRNRLLVIARTLTETMLDLTVILRQVLAWERRKTG